MQRTKSLLVQLKNVALAYDLAFKKCVSHMIWNDQWFSSLHIYLKIDNSIPISSKLILNYTYEYNTLSDHTKIIIQITRVRDSEVYPCRNSKFSESIEINNSRLIVNSNTQQNCIWIVYMYLTNKVASWLKETHFIAKSWSFNTYLIVISFLSRIRVNTWNYVLVINEQF